MVRGGSNDDHKRLMMNFCSNCGAKVDFRVPQGDDRPRFTCDTCHTVHYQNPCMVVGCIPESDGKVLLCRRSIEPRYGFWTIPAGYLENGETVLEAAMREAQEEAHAQVEIIAPYSLVDLPRFHQVYLIFRSRLLDHNYRAGAESLEVRLFSEKEIPWESLAFTSIRKTLRFYFRDHPSGVFPLRVTHL
jgi:ADP-ribose pyrophosphatase YjhB (NUDIX family)